MAGSEMLQTLLSTAMPVLPGSGLPRLALPVLWAVVLAGCVLNLGEKFPQRWRLGLTGLIAIWALMPGPVSITFWLGLMFQMPSLMTALICAVWLVRGLAKRNASQGSVPKSAPDPVALPGPVGCLGIALGWLLLLDTFAVLPGSMYRLGFGMAALVGVAGLVALFWSISGRQPGQGRWPLELVLAGLALALFVVTRLPTGNLWDALIDPWLWFVLQVLVLRRWIHRWRAR